MSLEELNYIFDTPTSKHVKYQTKIMLPWIIHRLTPGRPHESRPEPPYRWVRDQLSQDEQTQTQGQQGVGSVGGESDAEGS